MFVVRCRLEVFEVFLANVVVEVLGVHGSEGVIVDLFSLLPEPLQLKKRRISRLVDSELHQNISGRKLLQFYRTISCEQAKFAVVAEKQCVIAQETATHDNEKNAETQVGLVLHSDGERRCASTGEKSK